MAGFAGLHPQAWARLTLRGSFRRSFARPKPPAAACPVHRHLGGSFSLQPNCLESVALHPVSRRRSYRPITAADSQLGGRDFHSLDHRIHRRTPVPLSVFQDASAHMHGPSPFRPLFACGSCGQCARFLRRHQTRELAAPARSNRKTERYSLAVNGFARRMRNSAPNVLTRESSSLVSLPATRLERWRACQSP